MLKIRLRRMGAIRQPHYRIVVADARAPRDGAFIDMLGHYNPLTDPATIQVDVTKYEDWKKKGAQPTNAVASLVKLYKRAQAKSETAPAASTLTRTASGKRSARPSAAAPVAEASAAEEAPAVEEASAEEAAPVDETPVTTEEIAAAEETPAAPDASEETPS